MPPSNLTLTPALATALQQIDQTGFRPSIERLLRNGSSTVSLKALMQLCLMELSQALALSSQPARSSHPGPSSQRALHCLDTMRMALESVSNRPPFIDSLGAQTGLHHLISEIERTLQRLQADSDPEPAMVLSALLAREFQIEGYSLN